MDIDDGHDGRPAGVAAVPHRSKKPRYFERPDPDARPLTFRETLIVVLSSHIGIRTLEQRENDFRRANGLHLFITGIVYFLIIISGLIALVNYIAG